MIKVKVTISASYCGCPSEEVELEYDGTEREFWGDNDVSTEILNMLSNNEFPHYFIDYEITEMEEEDE